MSRLQELLSKRLTRGRDDAELDELARLLDALRRQPASGWEPCEVDGRPAYRQEVPLVAICHTCYRVRADG